MRILSLDERDEISSCSRQPCLLNEQVIVPTDCEAYILSRTMRISLDPKACV